MSRGSGAPSGRPRSGPTEEAWADLARVLARVLAADAINKLAPNDQQPDTGESASSKSPARKKEKKGR